MHKLFSWYDVDQRNRACYATGYIYRTSDNLYLIYSEGACQYSNESARTSLNIDTPLHCKSDTKCHVFCK